MQTFETERLILRPPTEEDAPFFLKLLNSPKWLKFIGDRNVHSLDDAKAYIRDKILPDFAKVGYSSYLVVRKSDGAKMGSSGLYTRAGLDSVDIGFALLPQYEQQGYGYESAVKLRDLAVHHFGIKNLCAITTKDNIASQRLLEKLGLRYVKIVNLPNDPEDLLLYEL